MNPYDVLGVSPNAAMADIETRYRLLLRECHPDLHQTKGPEAVARAEAQTRELNAAMDRIRRGDVGPDDRRPGGGRQGPGYGPGYGSARSGPSSPWGTPRPGPGPTGGWPNSGAGAGPNGRSGHGFSDEAGGPGRAGSGTGAGGSAGSADASSVWGTPPPDEDDGTPVPCPFCGVGFLHLADYEAHLVYAHRFRAATPGRPRQARTGVLDVIGRVRYVPVWAVLAIGLLLFLARLWWWLLGDLAFLALVLWAQTSPRFRNRRRWSTLRDPFG